MGNVLVQESSLQAIAGAIRSKTGGSDTYKPREMAPAIQSLSGAGVLQSLNVTENGNFTPPSGVDGFDRVSVAVPGGFGAGDEGKVVLNGALMPQTSLSVTANGTYDTTAKNSVVVSVSGGASLPTGLYVGEGTPDASLGSNGDVYFEYTIIPAYISSNSGGIIITDIGISPSHSIEAVAALTKQSSKWDIIFHAAYSTATASGVFTCGFLDSSNAALIFTKSTSHTGSSSQ